VLTDPITLIKPPVVATSSTDTQLSQPFTQLNPSSPHLAFFCRITVQLFKQAFTILISAINPQLKP
jgi:hypothetical protein